MYFPILNIFHPPLYFPLGTEPTPSPDLPPLENLVSRAHFLFSQNLPHEMEIAMWQQYTRQYQVSPPVIQALTIPTPLLMNRSDPQPEQLQNTPLPSVPERKRRRSPDPRRVTLWEQTNMFRTGKTQFDDSIRRCAECGTTTSPQNDWRNGPNETRLCNKHGLQYYAWKRINLPNMSPFKQSKFN